MIDFELYNDYEINEVIDEAKRLPDGPLKQFILWVCEQFKWTDEDKVGKEACANCMDSIDKELSHHRHLANGTVAIPKAPRNRQPKSG